MENATELRAPKPKANSRRAVIKATERLWRRARLDYDAIRAVSTEVRRRLQVERPKTRRTAPERLSRDEARRFIDAAYRASGARGLLLKVLLQSGARVSEFIALRVEDVHPEERTIQIVNGKGGKSRAVPVTGGSAGARAAHVHRRSPDRASVRDEKSSGLRCAARATDRG